jgi:hypothetical protein
MEGREAVLPEDLQRDTHARLGYWWQHAGEHLTRLLSDDLAALEHFLAAGLPLTRKDR